MYQVYIRRIYPRAFSAQYLYSVFWTKNFMTCSSNAVCHHQARVLRCAAGAGDTKIEGKHLSFVFPETQKPSETTKVTNKQTKYPHLLKNTLK